MLEALALFIEFALRILTILFLGAGTAAGVTAAILFWTKRQTAKAEAAHTLSGSQRFALDTVIEVAVQAAQQKFGASVDKALNDQKFLFVKKMVLDAKQALGIEISDEQLDLLIESAVFELKQTLK